MPISVILLNEVLVECYLCFIHCLIYIILLCLIVQYVLSVIGSDKH